MMDRIIFLGTGIDDQIANIVQAQLFSKAQMLLRIFKFTWTLQEEAFMQV
jgi:hypothetical protein